MCLNAILEYKFIAKFSDFTVLLDACGSMVNSLYTGYFFQAFVVICLFSKLTFSKNTFTNTIRVSKSLDPDQARHFVGPDLGPNCFQTLSEDSISCC